MRALDMTPDTHSDRLKNLDPLATHADFTAHYHPILSDNRQRSLCFPIIQG
jgi:hypothetical protein